MEDGIKWCIYMHTNMKTGEKYIGQTQDAKLRWNKHLYSGKMAEAIKKYGWDSFHHSIIKSELTKEQAYFWEAYYIKKFNTIENGYNTEPAVSKKLTAFNPDTSERMVFASRREAAKYFASDQTSVEGWRVRISRCMSASYNSWSAEGWYFFDGVLSREQAATKAQQHQTAAKNGGGKAVIVIYPDGKKTEFSTAKEAAEETGLSYAAVKDSAAKGRLCKGFYFKYKIETAMLMATKGKRVLYFASQRECSRKLSLPYANIANALLKPGERSVHGWKFKYVN